MLFPVPHYIFSCRQSQASGFLVSSNSRAVPEERELDENVYSNDDYGDSVSLLEQVLVNYAFLNLMSSWCKTFCYDFICNWLCILQDIRPGPSDQSGLSFVSGIICKSKALRFERMLFRATRGNMLFNQASADEQIMDPLSTEMVFFCLSIIKIVFFFSSCFWCGFF